MEREGRRSGGESERVEGEMYGEREKVTEWLSDKAEVEMEPHGKVLARRGPGVLLCRVLQQRRGELSGGECRVEEMEGRRTCR